MYAVRGGFASEIMWSDVDVEGNDEVKITEMRERIYASESKDWRQIQALLVNIQQKIENGNCDWSIYSRQLSRCRINVHLTTGADWLERRLKIWIGRIVPTIPDDPRRSVVIWYTPTD